MPPRVSGTWVWPLRVHRANNIFQQSVARVARTPYSTGDGVNLVRNNVINKKDCRGLPVIGRRFMWTFLLGAYGMGFAALGFYMTSSPLAGALAMLGMHSDEETLRQFSPDHDEARLVEKFIHSHHLTRELRDTPLFRESRPHMKLPALFRPRNLTAGTLLGPGRIVVPPFAWTDGGKSLVSIAYLGEDLCGHPGIVHGGILATLLDEGMARCCWEALPRKIAVTGRLEVNYRKPTRAGSYVVLRARTVKVEGRKAWVEGRLETLVEPGGKPEVLAEATGLFISPRPSTVLEKVL